MQIKYITNPKRIVITSESTISMTYRSCLDQLIINTVTFIFFSYDDQILLTKLLCDRHFTFGEFDSMLGDIMLRT